MRFMVLAAASATFAAPAFAQAHDHSAPAPQMTDKAAIEQTIRDVYAVISGPPGQKRDFAKMRTMFAPNALLRVITPTGLRGGTVEEYIARSGPMLEKEGFSETELANRIQIYGNLATSWSSYDGRTATGTFKTRGINSFQLVKIDGTWKVASILWQQETPQLPLPADMAGSPKSGK